MLWTGNYQLALGFIDKTFIDCDKNASPINHNHVLEYYYAAGMLNIKLGRLEEAEDSLEMVSFEMRRGENLKDEEI